MKPCTLSCRKSKTQK